MFQDQRVGHDGESQPSGDNRPTGADGGELLDAWYRGQAAALSRALRSKFGGWFQRTSAYSDNLGVHEVEDVVQEVCARVLASSTGPGLARTRDLKAYLFRAAHNLAIDMVRRRRTGSRLRGGAADVYAGLAWEAADATSPGERAECEALLDALAEYTAALPAELFALYRARFVLGMSQRDTADSLGVTRRRVRTLEERLIEGAIHMLQQQQQGAKE
jgi:RNA polymerase sigma factor (sigma-70 family)